MLRLIKGILKTAVTLCIVLILGAVCFRKEEMWTIIVSFYTNWSPGLVGTLLVAGALAAFCAAKEFKFLKREMRKRQ